jgi:hypothetical protein
LLANGRNYVFLENPPFSKWSRDPRLPGASESRP